MKKLLTVLLLMIGQSAFALDYVLTDGTNLYFYGGTNVQTNLPAYYPASNPSGFVNAAYANNMTTKTNWTTGQNLTQVPSLSGAPFARSSPYIKQIVAWEDEEYHALAGGVRMLVSTSEVWGTYVWMLIDEATDTPLFQIAESGKVYLKAGGTDSNEAASVEVVTNLLGTLNPQGFLITRQGWKDNTISAYGAGFDSASGALDWDYSNVGIKMKDSCSTNNNQEAIYFIFQTQHDWATNTAQGPHFHWIQPAGVTNGGVAFYAKFRWYAIGETNMPAFGPLQPVMGNVTTNYTNTAHFQLTMFPYLTNAAITGVSSHIEMVLYRDGDNDTYNGDEVLIKSGDMHYQGLWIGSANEGSY